MTALLTEGHVRPHPFLDHCTSGFLNQLEEFATEVNYRAGETILTEGHYADKFYLILEGKVSLELTSNSKAGITLQTLGPGDVLGWSWLYPPFQWHSTARAVESCRAVALNAAALLIRAEKNPAFGYELMKRVSRLVIRRLQATRKSLVQQMQSATPTGAELIS